MSAEDRAAPLAVSVEVGGALVGLGRQSAYLAAVRGDLPTVRFGRRKIVPVARLVEIFGRAITENDVERAQRVVAARKRMANDAPAAAEGR